MKANSVLELDGGSRAWEGVKEIRDKSGVGINGTWREMKFVMTVKGRLKRTPRFLACAVSAWWRGSPRQRLLKWRSFGNTE